MQLHDTGPFQMLRHYLGFQPLPWSDAQIAQSKLHSLGRSYWRLEACADSTTQQEGDHDETMPEEDGKRSWQITKGSSGGSNQPHGQ